MSASDKENSIYKGSSVDSEKQNFPYVDNKKSAQKDKTPSEKGNKNDGELTELRKKLEEKYDSLPPEEGDVLRSQTEFNTPSASIATLYRFARPIDLAIVALGVFFAVVHGVALPMFTLVLGAITNNFNSLVTGASSSNNDFQHTVDHNALYFVYIGVAIIVAATLESFILVNIGEILAGRYRENYLKAIIRQNVAYFDMVGSGQISTRITNDTASIQEGISEKLGNIIQGVASFVTALVIALTQQWKLACILLSVYFFNFFTMGFGSRFMVKYEQQSNERYTSGSSVAEEAFAAIRNTVAFGVQDKLVAKYDRVLNISTKPAEKAGMVFTIMLANIWSVLFFCYALAFWEGSRIIASGESSIGKIICVIIATLIGSFQLGNVAPNIRFVARAIGSAKSLNEVIDRVPVIDAENEGGEMISNFKGSIELKDVRFRYPSRPDVLVLPRFSLSIPAGHTVALVGSSGSGKSTIVGILERFYSPLSGSVTLDGIELSKLNLKWLRHQIGYVQQEPVLFDDSIYENIAYGLIGTPHENATQEEKRKLVEQATREANAYDFIQSLSDGFDTDVGDRGFLMSGGQKQRIAIARAIISNPKILLLDEATSALDTKSEGIVQDALDKASRNRTTIIIAHRLSTVKDADNIVVISKGEIVEQGTHSELMLLDGSYKRLVDAQQVVSLPPSYAPDDISSDPLEQKQPNTAPEIREDAMVAISPSHDDYPEPATIIPGVEDPEGITLWKVIKMLLHLNRKEHIIMLIGIAGSILLGNGYSGLGQLFGHIIEAIMVPESMYNQMRHRVNVLTAWLFFLGVMAYISVVTAMGFLTLCTHRLVRQVRLHLFKQMLRLDIAFFDYPGNSSGAMTSILAKEARAIEGLGGATFGQIVQSLGTLISGFATGLAYSWKVGLVALATVPIVLGCGFLRVRVMVDLERRGRQVYEKSGSMASEFAAAVRTVQSLTREGDVTAKYSRAISKQIRDTQYGVIRSAVLYGLSQGLTSWVIALIFWWGSTCMRRGEVHVMNYFVVFMTIILGSQIAGQIFSYAPDIGKARSAARNVYRFLITVPLIDSTSTDGIIPDPTSVQGNVEFRNVHFRYPTRFRVPVLNGINLSVTKGQYIALVGASGCGKSTTIGLIERFYDALSGEVLIDGINIKEYNLQAIRSHISLVQQEPVLYSGTIRENIALGWPGDDKEVTDEMVYAAARKANIHDFITSLPDGYQTTSGSRGSLLSGGQKQRVAIARALIRNPKVLLLDEATSALDSESEKVVQTALDEAAKGRTTIAIAHRLATIQAADVIYVFDQGGIVEKGSHGELMSLNGRYSELVKLQSLAV